MKANKIAIITLYGNYNYGNKLQNYAVEHIFSAYGIEPATIDYRKSINEQNARKIFRTLTGYHFSKNRKLWMALAKKEKLLKKFSDKNLHVIRLTNVNKLKKQFDFFCTGSDQVWNPVWFDDRTKHLMLLDFVDGKRKMSLSASFGVEQIPDEWKAFFEERLKEFEKISVREDAAERIVNELCGTAVETNIDPTLMLDSQEWSALTQKPAEYSEEYVKNSLVMYFLGEINPAVWEKVRNIAKQYKLHIIVLDRSDVEGSVIPSLEEWLYYIENAKLVVTDSFHGSVFSFLFDRNLLICSRKDQYDSMNSRLESLTEKFKLKGRLEENCLIENMLSHDYTAGYKALDNEREKLRSYIESVI